MLSYYEALTESKVVKSPKRQGSVGTK